jgi:hypothetical protein
MSLLRYIGCFLNVLGKHIGLKSIKKNTNGSIFSDFLSLKTRSADDKSSAVIFF